MSLKGLVGIIVFAILLDVGQIKVITEGLSLLWNFLDAESGKVLPGTH